MKKQLIVLPKDILERKELYDYLINNNYKVLENYKNVDFINNKFPFVIESNKTFWKPQDAEKSLYD